MTIKKLVLPALGLIGAMFAWARYATDRARSGATRVLHASPTRPPSDLAEPMARTAGRGAAVQ